MKGNCHQSNEGQIDNGDHCQIIPDASPHNVEQLPDIEMCEIFDVNKIEQPARETKQKQHGCEPDHQQNGKTQSARKRKMNTH